MGESHAGSVAILLVLDAAASLLTAAERVVGVINPLACRTPLTEALLVTRFSLFSCCTVSEGSNGRIRMHTLILLSSPLFSVLCLLACVWFR